MADSNSGKIGVLTATITGMNAMIGSGIFTAPAALAVGVGPAGILTYLFVVCAIWFMAQSIAKVASLFPQEGSFYAYAKHWGGHYVGVAAGSFYIIGLTIALGVLSHVAGKYMLPFFPGFDPKILGFLALGALVLLNMFGAVLSQIGQRILICTTVFPILTIIFMCFTKADTSLLTPFAPHGYFSVASASRIVIFGFFGFESAASLFNIVRNPKKNVPRALNYSMIIVGTLYILFVSAIILAVPLNLFTSADTTLTEALTPIFPNSGWLITTIHFAILSAILGTIHSIIWSASSLLGSLVKNLKSNFAKKLVRQKTINTRTSVLFIGIATFISFATIRNLDLFFDFTAIFLVAAYVSAMITLLTIKKEWTSGQNIKTILGIGTALLIMIFALQDVVTQLSPKHSPQQQEVTEQTTNDTEKLID